MRRSLFWGVLLAVFTTVTIAYNAQPAEEIRVWGGKLEDFKDSKGRIWHGGQNEKEAWGGWTEKLPPHSRSSKSHERGGKTRESRRIRQGTFLCRELGSVPRCRRWRTWKEEREHR